MHGKAWAYLLGAVLLWGFSYPLIHILLDYGYEPFWIVAVHCALGTMVLLSIAYYLRAFAGVSFLPLLAFSCLQIILPFCLLTFAQQEISASLAAILVASTALFTVLLSYLLQHDEVIHRATVIGLIIGFVGVGQLFGFSVHVDSLPAALMMLITSFSYACSPFVYQHFFRACTPIGVIALADLLCALALVPLALTQVPENIIPDGTPLLVFLALGLGGSGLAFIFYYLSLDELGPTRASIASYLIPLVAVAVSIIFLDETLTLSITVGLLLILLGSFVTGRRQVAPLEEPL